MKEAQEKIPSEQLYGKETTALLDKLDKLPEGEMPKLSYKEIFNIGLCTPIDKGLFWFDVGVKIAKAQRELCIKWIKGEK